MPLVPFSALHYLNNKFSDLLFHLRQEQAWQVLHLNLLICTVPLAKFSRLSARDLQGVLHFLIFPCFLLIQQYWHHYFSAAEIRF